MHRSVRSCGLLAAALFIPAVASATTQPPPPVEPDCTAADTVQGATIRVGCASLSAIDAAAEQLIESGYAPGLSVTVMRGNQTILSKGYGKANLETDTPVTPSTVFPLHSITKTFTASAIFQLRDAGLLSIDDKLSKFFPDFPRGGEVSLRQMLAHTSGIHDYVGLGRPDDKSKFTFDQLLQIMRTQTPAYDFDPGTKYEYSNSNYVLLAKIVEQVSGRPYRLYLRDSVIAKVPFLQLAIDQQMDIVPGRASGYWRTNFRGRYVNGSFHDPSFSVGAGGLRGTAPDLAQWFLALFKGKVVSDASLRDMMTPARLTDGRLTGGSWGTFGLGTQIQSCFGHRWIGHGGATTGFTAEAEYYVDDDLMIVVLANSSRTAAVAVERLSRILLVPGADTTCPH